MTPRLTVDALTKRWHGVAALVDARFAVAAGERVALIGPNGAGKSTCFALLGGQARPDRGAVRLDGRDVTAMPAYARARAGIARTFQVAQTFDSFDVAGNVRVALQAAAGRRTDGASLDARVAALLAEVGLEAAADRAASTLAWGDGKRLELAIALAAEPRVLLLDEPTAGVGDAERHALMALASRVARTRGAALLFTEHDMDVVFAHADRIVVLDHGRVIADAAPKAVRDDARVRAAYLGDLDAPPTAPGPVAVRSAAHDPASSAAVPATAAASAPRLALRALGAGWGASVGLGTAVDALDLEVRDGEAVGLLGRNGAGKSTTLKAVLGLTRWRRGAVAMSGIDLTPHDPAAAARAGIGWVPEGRRLFADLTVDEHLRAVARDPGRGAQRFDRAAAYALFPALVPLRDRRADAMSGGERQMLAIARALVTSPQVLLLDEPSEGLAPRVVGALVDALDTLRRAHGLALLIAEPNPRLALRLVSRVCVLDRGRAVWSGPGDALRRDPDRLRAWLSVGDPAATAPTPAPG
ncbi:MAG: ATP-binding cassette domain-containing protein [Burkholderiales bacterium]|nr:ATP-binding cassette domain-containing protein [Burkholderiales bacterium]